MTFNMRKWIEVKIQVTDQTTDAVSSFLFENGSTGLIVEGDFFIAYFDEENFINSVAEKLENYLIFLRNLGFKDQKTKFYVKSVKDRDWNRFWKKDLKPEEISSDILVVPSWIKKYPRKYKHVVKIDPGLAFGSGFHETTKIAARLLEKHCHGRKKMLDSGTGTGILTIIAKKLGIEKITAIDNYPLAEEIAGENLKLNGISGDEIVLRTEDLSDFKGSGFDLITANIEEKILSDNIEVLINAINNGGIIIFSGILKSNKNSFVNVLRRNKLKFSDELIIGDWIGFAAEKA
ncbi:50S ribosomal protein L11 methyltransferase [candidate division KSB1 bacterium]